ncbi:hypothetical protein chiPu_0012808 [Chiloscyllium punctatum]|uniref:Ig-like domain-containing protein n=1 Tax=Chiloscyllium punctatum TaxID=137246 RepID=A0A401SVB7_CHIPU|nr:hypothetical protein [Chiloscyllium punctatum]
MWSIVLLICSLSVSGALSAEKNVKGIVGRAITINCSYDKQYQQNMKYWCHGWTNQCTYVVRTDDPEGQRGRMSIKDNKARGVFIVTMENLQRGDAGWYSCGIDRSGLDLRFALMLQVSYESISIPVLKFTSPPNVSCSGGSVSISCESVRGSPPIYYKWYERTSSHNSKISDTNKLDLHCQSFKQQNHQYYCTAKNQQAIKDSGMVKVSVINRSANNCSYVVEISSIGQNYSCEVSSTTAPSTSANNEIRSPKSKRLVFIIVGVLGAFLIVLAVSLLWYMKKMNKGNCCIICSRRDQNADDNQQLAAAEDSIIYANVRVAESSSSETRSDGNVQFNKNENGINYATIQFQKKSSARTGEMEKDMINNTNSVTYSEINTSRKSPENIG